MNAVIMWWGVDSGGYDNTLRDTTNNSQLTTLNTKLNIISLKRKQERSNLKILAS